MRHRVRVLAIGTLAIGLAAAGCSKNTGSSASGSNEQAKQQAITVDYKGTTKTPAPDVPGAKPGGTINWLEDGAPEHLDPQQIYVSDALSIGTQLIHRSLTGYIEHADGTLNLVGDLATNAGEQTEGGKVWTYHLRDGIKFEDGSPITSKDVAYGVARAFSKYGAQGPQYLQEALDPKGAYKGPYSGQLQAPGVTTPDDKTIVFTFTEAHPEMPYLAAFPTTTPVPQAKDTKDKYDDTWVATGPYKRESLKKDQQLILVKNPNWDPKTDPIRHQYVDSFKLDYTQNQSQQTQRIMADQGDDQTALNVNGVAQESIAQVQGDQSLKSRTLAGPTPYDNYLYINNARVTDVDVRRALNYAMNRDAIVKAYGGSAVAAPSTTLLAANVPGYKQYDAYPSGPTGNPDKAKELLKGKTVPRLSLCFANTKLQQSLAAVIQQSLSAAGIQVALTPIDKAAYYTTVGKKGTTCDLIRGGWGADYPDGDSTLGVLFDGTKIVPEGNNNLAYFNDPTTNDKLKSLRAETDRGATASKYGDLDEQIMKDQAPVVPLYYLRSFLLTGSKVGGTFNDSLFANPYLANIYVKS